MAGQALEGKRVVEWLALIGRREDEQREVRSGRIDRYASAGALGRNLPAQRIPARWTDELQPCSCRPVQGWRTAAVIASTSRPVQDQSGEAVGFRRRSREGEVDFGEANRIMAPIAGAVGIGFRQIRQREARGKREFLGTRSTFCGSSFHSYRLSGDSGTPWTTSLRPHDARRPTRTGWSGP